MAVANGLYSLNSSGQDAVAQHLSRGYRPPRLVKGPPYSPPAVNKLDIAKDSCSRWLQNSFQWNHGHDTVAFTAIWSSDPISSRAAMPGSPDISDLTLKYHGHEAS